MTKIPVIFVFFFLALTAFGAKKPKNIDEAILYFEKKWSDKEKEAYKIIPEKKAVSEMHFSVGIWIRHEWIQNEKDTALINHFHSLGIFHQEDMSAIILTSLHRKLNNLPIELEDQVNSYKNYWKPFNACDEKAKQLAVENYKKSAIGDSITIFMKVDDNFGSKNARTVDCPDTEWSFDYKKDLIIKGIISEKHFLGDERNVFFKVKITYMNFENIPILFKSAKPGDTLDLNLKNLLLKR